MTETLRASQFFGVAGIMVETSLVEYACAFYLFFSEIFDLVARYRQMTWWGVQLRGIS